MAFNPANTVDLTGNLVEASAFSIDTPDVFGSSGSKSLTTGVSTAGANITTATITTTKYAGTILLSGTSGALLAQSGGGTFTLTINNSNIAANDTVYATTTFTNTTNVQGNPTIGMIAPSAGAVVITVVNAAPAATAFCGQLSVSYVVFKN